MIEIIHRNNVNRIPHYPTCGDTVKIGYVIKTVEGKAIDWSRKPLTFVIGDPCSSIIEGFHMVLPYIEKGSRVKAFIPAQYGFDWNYPIKEARNEDLIVEIELLKIKK